MFAPLNPVVFHSLGVGEIEQQCYSTVRLMLVLSSPFH